MNDGVNHGVMHSERSEIAPCVNAPHFPWWLRNRHLQSIYPSFPLRQRAVVRRAAPLIATSREWIIDCGDGVRLLCRCSMQEERGADESRSIVVLLHGWEGSADSLYMLTLGQQLYEHGYDIVRLNLRDHGASHHLNRELFNSCRLSEVVGAVGAIQARWPQKSIHLVGFSLGGNFWLRVGARAPAVGLSINKIIAISPVIDPERTMAELENGHPLYRKYFVWKWGRSLRRKQLAWPDDYDFNEILCDRSLTAMTDVLVHRYTDYPDTSSYLRGYALIGDVLAPLETPALIIASADDPIIPVDDLERLARVSALRIARLPHGGHCGFVTGVNGSSWIAAEVERELARR